MLHKIKSCFYFLTIFFFTCSSFLATASAADVPTPSLKVKQQDDGRVRVRWNIEDTRPRYRSVLQLQRSAGAEFVNIGQFESPRSHTTFYDSLIEDGIYKYRAKLLSRRGNSRWSKSVSVAVQVNSPTEAPIEIPVEVEEETEWQEEPAEEDDDERYYDFVLPQIKSAEICSAALPADVVECPTSTEDSLIAIVNQERGRTRTQLQKNQQMSCAARSHNLTQVALGNITHENWVLHLVGAGYEVVTAAQNVAHTQSAAPSYVMSLWMNSPGHRANILSTAFNEIGVSCLRDAKTGRHYWVQYFGG